MDINHQIQINKYKVFSDNHKIILFFDIKFNDINGDCKNINCDYKNIKIFLIKINCSKNNIQDLGKMTEYLEWLDCAGDILKKINIESNKLVWLNCSYNNTENVDNLPCELIFRLFK